MKPLITDDQRLVGAVNKFGSALPIYDDGFGPLWIHRDSMGISGIVRAQTWSDAYSICEDEFLPECELTMEEIVDQYGFKREHLEMVRHIGQAEEFEARPEHYPLKEKGLEFARWILRESRDPEAWMENELFQEAYGFRPNGRRSKKDGKDRDPIGHGIYAKDLNGELLNLLTSEMLTTFEITLQIEEEDYTP